MSIQTQPTFFLKIFKVSIDSYNTQNRGGQGVISIKTSERNGSVVGAVNLDNSDYIMLITNKGKTIKTDNNTISNLFM